MTKKTVYQKHHIVYGEGKNKECVREIRKGCHQIITLIRRYKTLTDQEINTILLECELKRDYTTQEWDV